MQQTCKLRIHDRAPARRFRAGRTRLRSTKISAGARAAVLSDSLRHVSSASSSGMAPQRDTRCSPASTLPYTGSATYSPRSCMRHACMHDAEPYFPLLHSPALVDAMHALRRLLRNAHALARASSLHRLLTTRGACSHVSCWGAQPWLHASCCAWWHAGSTTFTPGAWPGPRGPWQAP